MSAAMALQEAEVGVTERQVAECDAAREQYDEVMARWNGLKGRLEP
jgi:hypothetical protein